MRAALLTLSFALASACCLMPWIAGNFATYHLTQFLALWAASLVACLFAKGQYARLSLIGIPIALFPILYIFIGGLITGDWP
jgi:hypothetical protein